MSRHEQELLDRAVDRLRHAAPDPETVRAAADRVWRRLAAEPGAAAPPTTATPAAEIGSLSCWELLLSLL
jgi:hypothetical protein